jgi:sensor histidine kinase YesM
MEKVRSFIDKKFFKHWFLHALILFLVSIFQGTGTYMYRSYIQGGYFITNVDGTPETALQYFFNVNLRFVPMLTMAIISFFIELNYRKVLQIFDNGFFSILKSSIFFTLFTTLFYTVVIFRGHPFKSAFLDIIGVFVFFTFYALAYSYIRYAIEKQKRNAQNRYQKSQAELDVLKAQLNPHFFFNSLNNLYGTALQENAPNTVGLIEQLSSIMRYTMGEAQNSFTNVKNEIDFIENYWALQEVRLPKKDNIQLSKHLFFDEKPTEIAPLLLIPFIENAFKYGSSIDKDCKIDLNLVVKNQQLKMVLSNIIQADKTLDKGNGIGIENTKKRLDLIYGNRYSLTHRQEGNMYKVVLNIQLT